jgi:hypothetical protein
VISLRGHDPCHDTTRRASASTPGRLRRGGSVRVGRLCYRRPHAPAPSRLDEAGAEELLNRVARRTDVPDAIDCSGVRFADPYGVLVLLSVGLSAPYRRGRAWGLILPRDPAVRSWLERCGARRQVEKLFIVDEPSGAEDQNQRDSGRDPVLLEVALVREGADVHRAVSRIRRGRPALVSRLRLPGLAADRFTVAMAEVCQNVVDTAAAPAALAQCYLRPAA